MCISPAHAAGGWRLSFLSEKVQLRGQRGGVNNGFRVTLIHPVASKWKRAADDSLDNSKYDWLIKPLVPTGALQLPLSGLELVMFRNYQFKPPFPQEDMALGQRVIWMICKVWMAQGEEVCPLPCLCPGPGASSSLGPREAWMLYGLHYGEGRDLSPRESDTERRDCLYIK